MNSEQTASWPWQELHLARIAVALGALYAGGPLSHREARLARAATELPAPSSRVATEASDAIRSGKDPLGECLLTIRERPARRLLGQVLTPNSIVNPMAEWVLDHAPSRIVDAGCGSGRFALALAARTDAPIVAFDTDALCTLITRAALAVSGNATVAVENSDYTQAVLARHSGRTAFVGNPPYVRHHNLSPETKLWAEVAAARLGVPISGLAGLHAYFFLATALHGRPGDIGCFVTSSEWLDVNYGDVIRRLLLNTLGGRAVHVLEPRSAPFDKTAVTAAITCFEMGPPPESVRIRMVYDAQALPPLTAGQPISRERLAQAQRWSPFMHAKPLVPDGYVELGEVCRVHRGTVTGSNATWVVSATSSHVIPERYLFPSVTRARELINAGDCLESTDRLRRVIDLPADLDELEPAELKDVEQFLRFTKANGVADGYVAQNRKAWWSVGLREPAPILATYMARRAPVFVKNPVDARNINIAHGLYPRGPLPQTALDRLVVALRASASVGLGRTYAGGLVKFEPREMERVPVPSLDSLLEPQT